MRKFSLILIIYVVILGFSVLSTCWAQKFSKEELFQIDSINKVINNPKSHDSTLANSYLLLAEILYVSNVDTIIPLCEKAKKIAELGLGKIPLTDTKRRNALLKPLAGAYNNIGYVYLIKGNVNKAIEYYDKAKPISEKIGDQEALFSYFISVGYIYMEQGEIEKALEYYLQSLTIGEKMGDKQNMASSLNNIGYIYEHQDDFEKGLEYYKKSLNIYLEINNKSGIANGYSNIGVLYNNRIADLIKNGASTEEIINKRNEVLDYHQKSLKIRREIGEKKGISASLNIIGELYSNQVEELKKSKGNDDSIRNIRDISINYFKESLNIREEIEDRDGMTFSLNSLAQIMIEQGQLAEASDLAGRSFRLSNELGYPKNIRNAARLLSEIYKKQNKGIQALEMFELYIHMRDSINNDETQKSTIKQEAKYEYEKQKVIDDAEHKKILAIKQEEKKQQQILTTATVAILALVLMFLSFVFNRLKVTRKQKFIIEEQNNEILDSINYAKRIQDAILPSIKLVKELLPESFIYYQPKDIVAGDFYWIDQIGDNILFAAADCTGHGVPGAMVSVVCNNALNRVVRDYELTEPGKMLDKTCEIIVHQFGKSKTADIITMNNIRDGMDIALCVLNKQTKVLQYSGANNPLWIIRNEQKVIEEFKATKQSIGQIDNKINYETHQIQLYKGDSIYIFSDGFADQFGGAKGKKLMYKPFKELLISIRKENMEKQQSIIRDYFEDWKGDLEQVDDICVIGVKI